MRDFRIDFDHMDPDYGERLYEITSDLREGCPVARGSNHGGFWALSRYADVYAAAHDPSTFSSAEGITLPSYGNPMPTVPLECDPPDNRAYRAMLAPRFSPAAVSADEPMIRQVVTDLIDEFCESGAADLAQDFAVPLPAIVVSRIMGLPESMIAQMIDWSNRCFEKGDPEAMAAFLAFLSGQLQSRRERPRDDLLTVIATGEANGGPLDHDTAIGMAQLVAAAGFETTGSALEHLLRHVAADDDLRRIVLDEPGQIPAIVEESLRFHTPLQGVARTVTTDTAVADVALRKGDRVALLWGSANRDESQFAAADTFDHTRSPNRHLSFGHGPHVCLGAHLARAEMVIATHELFARLPDLEVVGEPSVIHRNFVRAIDHLPVRFSPKARTTD
jgi:cytochrome P450